MALKTLGWVTVAAAGTPIQASSTRIPAHAVFIQTVAAMTGPMHIGLSASMDATTGVDMLATLVTPSLTALPSWGSSVDGAPNGIDLQEIWIDADVSGEKVLVSYLEG